MSGFANIPISVYINKFLLFTNVDNNPEMRDIIKKLDQNHSWIKNNNIITILFHSKKNFTYSKQIFLYSTKDEYEAEIKKWKTETQD